MEVEGSILRLRDRDAKAGGILGVNTPPPHFLEDPKKWKLERVGNKNFFRGCKKKGKRGLCKKKERSSKKLKGCSFKFMWRKWRWRGYSLRLWGCR